jgi:Putative Flp pilus-assembly TadE/G-like
MVIMSQIRTRILNTVKSFALNRDANVGMMFGLCLLPIIAATGSAVDYSRASNARTTLQSAVDATALAIAKRTPLLSDSQLMQEAETFFRANLSDSPDLADLPLKIRRSKVALNIEASGSLQTAFMNIFGLRTIPISTAAEATIGQRKVEIALALDNTGSMARLSKMDELKKATRNMIDAAEATAPAGSGILKIAVVPFDTEVRLDPSPYRNQSWLAFKEDAQDRIFDDIRSVMAPKAAWTGCITDRGPGFDTNDKRVDVTRKESFFPAVKCSTPNLAPVQTLTDNWNALRNAADRMRPSGCTNITIGARFGMAALSPSEPIGTGVAFGTPDVDKYLIILTDGDNTKNRYLDRCSTSGSAAAIDDKTTALCDDIKARSSRRDARGQPIADIKVFTIRVMEGNRALLENCASNPSMYKEVSNASDIDKVFKDILKEITQLKLTM